MSADYAMVNAPCSRCARALGALPPAAFFSQEDIVPMHLASPRGRLAVLMDFDGTLTEADMGSLLLDAFASPDWRKLEGQWKAGVIPTFKEMNEREFSYLPASQRQEMVRFALASARLRQGAQAFVDFCKRQGIPLEIVSGGLDFYLRPILSQHGMGHLPVACLKAADFEAGDRIQPTYPEGIVVCAVTGACKCAPLWRYRDQGYTTVYVGDGNSDRCVARQADILFARDALARYCREQGIAFTPFETFHEVTEILKPLAPSSPNQGAV